MQAHLRKLAASVAPCNFEELEHEALTVQLADKRAASLLANQHMLGHQRIHCAPHGADGHVETPGKIGFIGQRCTGRGNAGLNICDQLPLDLTVQQDQAFPFEAITNSLHPPGWRRLRPMHGPPLPRLS
ncbi:MAG: hypothetical protein MUP33_05345 [Polaromonas sp.]|nr:hypothetical protein [Polaromonas sp.]